MQGFQRTIQSIAANLRGLTPTARLLVGSLMIIALMSLFLVSLYAGRTELTPLGLRPDVSDAVKAQVIDYLDTRGIPYEARGDDVFIDSSRKIEVLGQLADRQLIGGDQINFETLIADSSPFRTREENRQRYLVAKMNVLSGMIGQMSGIERARVVIDPPDSAGGIGRPIIPSSASVSVQTRGAELSQAQVDAIAHLIARSHAGLKPENVAVIDARSGRSLQARNDEMTALGRYLELRQAAERHTRNALAGALDFIPGVLIEVNAQVNAADEVRQTSTMTDPASGVTEGTLRLADSPIERLDDERAERLPFIDIGSLGSRAIQSSGPVLKPQRIADSRSQGLSAADQRVHRRAALVLPAVDAGAGFARDDGSQLCCVRCHGASGVRSLARVHHPADRYAGDRGRDQRRRRRDDGA